MTISSKLPIIKNFSETNILKAFILLSILQTIILSLTFGARELMNDLEYGQGTKFLLSILYGFFITFFSLSLMYIIFGYGRGMTYIL